MAVKCPNCGAENPESVEFCIRCGKPVGSPESLQGRSVPRSRSATAKGAVVSIAVVLAMILLALGLSYSQPWSEIRITVHNNVTPVLGIAGSGGIWIALFIDGHQVHKGWVYSQNETIVSAVEAGHHLIEMDAAADVGAIGAILDGVMDFSDRYYVMPFSTQSIGISYPVS